MKKRVLKLLTLSVCLLMLSATSVMAEDPVFFADANLKAAVENELALTNPTLTDMLSLTSLDASNPPQSHNNEIEDLTGIDYAMNLTYLYLGGNQISDISALARLTSLEVLYLWVNQISDISALAELTSLTHLGLSWNQISDISALAGLTSLVDLSLGHNQIGDISALAGLTSLKFLDLWLNQISDISTLSGLTSLTDLILIGNQISDISALAGLTSLTHLELSGNQISDISALSGLTNMSSLWLDGNQISDISALAELTSLTSWLVLEGNPLNTEAYCIYLPLIEDNNPGINLMYDPNPYPPEACLGDDGVPDRLFSIEGTQWRSSPIGMILFPITDIGPIDPYEVGFYDGKVYFHGPIYGGFQYEPADEKWSFYMDMLVASIFMYSGRSCQMPDGCWDYIVLGIMQPIGVGVMMVSNGFPIPSSVGGLLLVKTEDNWSPPEDIPTTE